MENWANFGLVVLFGLVGDGSLTMFAGGYFLPPEPVFLTNGTVFIHVKKKGSLDGGFKDFFCSPLLGEDSHFD